MGGGRRVGVVAIFVLFFLYWVFLAGRETANNLCWHTLTNCTNNGGYLGEEECDEDERDEEECDEEEFREEECDEGEFGHEECGEEEVDWGCECLGSCRAFSLLLSPGEKVFYPSFSIRKQTILSYGVTVLVFGFLVFLMIFKKRQIHK